MIDPKEYPTPQMGQSIKVAHLGCSSSEALKITAGEVGALYHCFKCGESLVVPHEDQSYQARKLRQRAHQAAKDERHRKGYSLPVDFSQTISPPGLAWLGSGGWTPDMIRKYKIGWSPRLSRVILPVHPAGWIGRAVLPGHHPKYFSKASPNPLWYSTSTIVDNLCIVEDILSAGRIGVYCPCVALLGTSSSWLPLVGVSRVVIWMDDDAAGRKCRREISELLAWSRKEVHHIETTKDPKHLTNKELKHGLRTTGVYP